jgi:hypothetical protein
MPAAETTIQDFDVELSPDREWRSKPIRLTEGTRVTLTATGAANFYAGLFSREEYVKRTAVRGPFGFDFGSDRASFTDEIPIAKTDDYYLVFRVGVFSRAQTIRVRWVAEPPRS